MTIKERKRVKKGFRLKYLALLWQDLNHNNFRGALTRQPLFELRNDVSFLAGYRFDLVKGKPKNGTIIINEKLYLKAPKKIFINAILHEMAHQLCIEELGLLNEDHGKIWQLICLACGAVPHYSCSWKS